MSRFLDKTIMAGLLAAIVFTALAHGAVEPWSVAIFELLVIVLLLLWAVKAVIARRLAVTIPPVALPVAALVALGVIQSVAFTGGGGQRLSLSKDVEATRAAAIALFLLFAALLVAVNFFSTRDRLRFLANFLIVYGLAMAVFALAQHFTWNGRFYWVRLNTQSASPFGPYVNHNHFAGYMEMLIPLPVALAMTRRVSAEMRLLYGFAALVMIVALVTSLSRGGMISLAASALFFLVMRWRMAKGDASRRAPSGLAGRVRQAVAAAAVLVAVAIGILWIDTDAVFNRITKGSLTAAADPRVETFYNSRGWIWQDTLAMIRANPLLGVGIGAYQTAHPVYSHLDRSLIVGYAHNDYLQVLADGGIVGGGIALWFFIVMWRTMARAIKSRDALLRWHALGAGAGIFAILTHSLFDFNLQIPANALLFLTLLAVVARVGAGVTDANVEEAPEIPVWERGHPARSHRASTLTSDL